MADNEEEQDDDDDNWTVESTVSAMTDDGSVHTVMDTSVGTTPISLSSAAASSPSVSPRPQDIEIVIPARKFKIRKNQALLLGFAADVVEKITSGLDQDAVVEMVKRRIKDENQFALGNKFLDVMTAGGWPDMQPIDDKEEDDFLSDMQSLSVSIFDNIDYEY
jgi:hypothetical protein